MSDPTNKESGQTRKRRGLLGLMIYGILTIIGGIALVVVAD